MDHFTAREGRYFCEDVAVEDIAAKVGTPAYVYSQAALNSHCQSFLAAFASYPTLACFAVKALSNLSVLRTIFAAGLGADLVSLGELQRALHAGVNPERIVFSGVGKRAEEIRAALKTGILMFNVESPWELDLIASEARDVGVVARVSLRVNPNIDAKTNEKIATGLYSTKFGLPVGELAPLLAKTRDDPNLELVGLACHIGSQIVDLGPMREAAASMVKLSIDIQKSGFPLRYLNMGGGLGIRYRDETPPALADYGRAITDAVRPTGLQLIVEPGRVLVGNIGVLLTRVIGVKKTPERHFVVVDAAMNDLLRPTLYGSYHEILAAKVDNVPGQTVTCDFVGPVCETGDFLGKSRELPLPHAGELFVVRGCGAYGSSMASQYNSRPRAPEVMIDRTHVKVIRPRETLSELWAGELAALES